MFYRQKMHYLKPLSSTADPEAPVCNKRWSTEYVTGKVKKQFLFC